MACLWCSPMSASSERCTARLMNCGGTTGGLLSCTTPSSSGPARMREAACLLLTSDAAGTVKRVAEQCPETI